MAKDPDERYTSCRELVEAARAELHADERHFARRRRPHWSVLAALGAALVAAAVAGVLLATGGAKRAGARPTTAITAESLQRIDPKTNRLAATIPVGSESIDVAAGEGGVGITVSPD
jgi:hypothetical protein